ncbi:MAG: peptidyl-prolyl cis-trans isomerase, partial [Deltaproteobacteria bacterium]|nr:peptidyl-prolyl cis-trans isomerase [Deltaproteobacteria bacterium]
MKIRALFENLQKILLPLVIVLLLGAPANGEVIDKVVGIVNEDIITLSELLNVTQRHTLDSNALNSSGKMNEILQQLIEQKLIAQEARKSAVIVSDAEVDASIEKFKESNQISTDQLKQALQEQGVPWNEYREQFREEIGKQHLLAAKVRSQVTITDKDAEDYYEAHLEEYVVPPRVRIEQLFFPVASAAPDKTKDDLLATANQALARIRSGESLQAVASIYNLAREGDSVDLGYFKKGELMAPLDAAAFSLGAGNVSDVVVTEKGYFIIRVLEKTDAQTKTVEEVKEVISNALYRQKMEKKYQEWMQQLRDKAYID